MVDKLWDGIDEHWIIALKKLTEEVVEDHRVTGTRKRTFDIDIHTHLGTYAIHVTFDVISGPT